MSREGPVCAFPLDRAWCIVSQDGPGCRDRGQGAGTHVEDERVSQSLKLWTGSGFFSRRSGPAHSPILLPSSRVLHHRPERREGWQTLQASGRLAEAPTRPLAHLVWTQPSESPANPPTPATVLPGTPPDTSFKLQNITSKQRFRIHHQHANTRISICENTDSIPWTHTERGDSGHASALRPPKSTEGLRPGVQGAPRGAQDRTQEAEPTSCSPSASGARRTAHRRRHQQILVGPGLCGTCRLAARPRAKLEP